MKRIVVCMKAVPDPKYWSQVSMDPETKTLKREGIPTILNPLDRHALEAALSTRETRGGEVVILSMGPRFVLPLLREGLAMGADRAILLSDSLFAGSDTLATARVLAAGCRRIEGVELICCGNLSVDGSTAQVPTQLAELLGLPSVMHVAGMDLREDGSLLIFQKIENGYTKLRGRLPLLVSVRKEMNKPRYIPFSGILAAEDKDIQVLSNEDLGLDPCLVGLEGSPTKMAGMELRRYERAKERLEGSPDEIVGKLMERLYQYGVI